MHHLAEDGLPHLPDLALASASGAAGGRCARLCAGAIAMGAGLLALEVDLPLHPEDRLRELECDGHLQVAAAPRRLPRSPPAGESELPEELVEDVCEVHRVVPEASQVAESFAADSGRTARAFPVG